VSRSPFVFSAQGKETDGRWRGLGRREREEKTELVNYREAPLLFHCVKKEGQRWTRLLYERGKKDPGARASKRPHSPIIRQKNRSRDHHSLAFTLVGGKKKKGITPGSEYYTYLCKEMGERKTNPPRLPLFILVSGTGEKRSRYRSLPSITPLFERTQRKGEQHDPWIRRRKNARRNHQDVFPGDREQ